MAYIVDIYLKKWDELYQKRSKVVTPGTADIVDQAALQKCHEWKVVVKHSDKK